MNKHTPGPWRVERQNPSPTTGEWMIAGGKPGYLAEIRDCGSGDVQANARLIAAAPDLLEELKDLCGAISSMNASRHQAIVMDGDLCYWQREEWVRWMLDEILPHARAAIAKATEPTCQN